MQPEEPQDTDAQPAADPNVKEIERLTQEVQDLKDKYVRSVAEMENIRRRMDRERSDLIKYSLESLFKDFLPALDSLEKALPETGDAAPKPNGGASEGSASYYDGMMMVKKQFLDIFKKHGLEILSARGAPFDPNVHQAIARVESPNVKIDTVGDEYARGYLLNGRLLRPAMVSVLTPTGG
jgi:molecular chaperone GrpE